MRQFFALFVLTSMSMIASIAPAATGSTVPYSPVQDGFVSSAPAVQKWAPDRVMIQFTVAGLQLANLPVTGNKSAAPVSRTGIVSLDAALDAVGATTLRAAFPTVGNPALARNLGINRWYMLDLAPGADILAVTQRLTQDTNLADAQPDYRAFAAVAPNDPNDLENWGNNNTGQLPGYNWAGGGHNLPGVGTPGFDSNAHAAWGGSVGFGSPGVIVAILDSGVDVGHPDLTQVTGYDFGDHDPNPMDDSAQAGHGTACAGVAAGIANNGIGVAGIAGGCSIMPLKVANSSGGMFFSSIDQAIVYAADNGADVISMSFGAATNTVPSTDSAISYAYSMGVTLLAATGNENAGTISYPAINAQVIGVGAASPCGDRKRSSSNSNEVSQGINTDPNGYTCDGERWWGSNYGNGVQDNRGAVDIIAPTILPTTDIQGGAGYAGGNYSSFFNGTSAATPYAAGVCALIKSANPGFSPNQVRAQLVGTAQDIVNVESGVGWDRYSGYGMVDAATAVGAVIPPSTAALFAAVDSIGCAPFAVSFVDQSIGNITNWVWDFGDGNLGVGQNPTHVYTNPGTYDVNLSVSGPDGNANLTKIGFIVANDVPAVSFTSSISLVAAGAPVGFTDTSSGSPHAWTWDFGDGAQDTTQNPTHIYTQSGAYSVSLTATNTCGPGSLTMPFMIIVMPPAAPVAGFTSSPATGCAPLPVQFTDISTGVVNSWAWDFGDGVQDTTQSPNHTYNSAGSYDVTLIVTNGGGVDTMTVAGAAIVSGPPVTVWTVSDTLIPVGGSITFTDTSTPLPGSWAWDFGDGGVSQVQNPVYQFNTPGAFDVSLITTNGCGADTVVVLSQITVQALSAPVADFSYTPATGCAPLAVTFSDSSLNNISAWAWDFGDGAQDTTQSPSHTYLTAGLYDVRLIVSGTGGADTLTVAGAVAIEATSAAAFTVSDTLGFAPLGVTFTSTSGGNPTSWLWNFGDASSDTVANPVHTYTTVGTFTVTLIVGNGCSSDTLIVAAAVTISGLSGVGDQAPARFGLVQNYPNPFNPSTTFVYSLEKQGRARLEIYDLSGRRIATLVNADKAAGQHEITWRPADLPSGVYFSRLPAGGRTDTRRVTLLK